VLDLVIKEKQQIAIPSITNLNFKRSITESFKMEDQFTNGLLKMELNSRSESILEG